MEFLDLLRGHAAVIRSKRLARSIGLVGLARSGALLAVTEGTALELLAGGGWGRRGVEPRVGQGLEGGHAVLRVNHEQTIDELFGRQRNILPVLLTQNSQCWGKTVRLTI